MNKILSETEDTWCSLTVEVCGGANGDAIKIQTDTEDRTVVISRDGAEIHISPEEFSAVMLAMQQMKP